MKFLKWVGIVLGILVILVLGFLAYINWAPFKTYSTAEPEITIDTAQATIAMGHRLAKFHCIQCHMDPETQKLSGMPLQDLPLAFGKAWSANITQHPTLGLGRYSDGQLLYLLRTGIKKDGQMVPPWMPHFNLMTDKEILSIISWLRSPDPILEPVAKVQQPSQPSLLAKGLMRFAFKPGEFPTAPISTPDSSDKVALGRYILTGQQGCWACHSADFATNDDNDPEKSKGYLGGGNEMTDKEGNTVYSKNITPDKETGMGNWTFEQFSAAMRNGIAPDGPLHYPMPIYALMTDAELEALWAYLQTVPAISNKNKPHEAKATSMN